MVCCYWFVLRVGDIVSFYASDLLGCVVLAVVLLVNWFVSCARVVVFVGLFLGCGFRLLVVRFCYWFWWFVAGVVGVWLVCSFGGFGVLQFLFGFAMVVWVCYWLLQVVGVRVFGVY